VIRWVCGRKSNSKGRRRRREGHLAAVPLGAGADRDEGEVLGAVQPDDGDLGQADPGHCGEVIFPETEK
jgi:hypothetical protein